MICFPSAEIAQFLLAVRTLGYKEKPDYDALRKVLSHVRPRGPLDLSRPRAAEPSRSAANRVSMKYFGPQEFLS